MKLIFDLIKQADFESDIMIKKELTSQKRSHLNQKQPFLRRTLREPKPNTKHQQSPIKKLKKKS